MPFRRRSSLTVKIPAILSVLLLAALAAMSVASYLELRREVVDLATTRLQQAARQMSGVLAASAVQRTRAMQQLMAREEIVSYLRSRDAALEPAIRAAITAYLGTAIDVGDVELWDPQGERLLVAGAAFPAVTADRLAEHVALFSSSAGAVIGPLRLEGGSIIYPIGGRIVVAGTPLGYVVERRRIANPSQTTQTLTLLTGLIGNDASIVAGNADGSAWSDLITPVDGVPITGTDRLWDYQRPGKPRTFAWAELIRQTPWIVAVEFPREQVLAPAERLLTRSLAVAGALLVIVATVGWIVTRRLTVPLRRVTEAAEAVADSKPHVRLEFERGDEVGRLADSFNAMSEKVEQARADLESRVEQRTAELRAANRELEAFSYSVSHDLRAPLRAIAGFVQILEEDHGAALDASARHHLERVKLNARRMGQLIDDLLMLSRIGRAAIVRQTIDLAEVARVVAREAIAASGRSIELTVDALPPCYGESTLLNQALINLIGNAVKFTARAERPAIVIGSTTADGETVYHVRDNGVGFDARHVEKLFGVFQRLHRSDEFEGTGVGLAIVHRVITRHGGRVWAEGGTNAGATFYFTIPGVPPS